MTAYYSFYENETSTKGTDQMIIEQPVTLTSVIAFATKIVVTTIVNEDEYEVEISRADAVKIVTAAKAVDSVMNPQNNNFYANESRYSQVAYYNEVIGTLFIGQ
tara:strand:- start:558 stop:869 length:312 start_codon:yes stop_codon:yes gene_type:complete